PAGDRIREAEMDHSPRRGGKTGAGDVLRVNLSGPWRHQDHAVECSLSEGIGNLRREAARRIRPIDNLGTDLEALGPQDALEVEGERLAGDMDDGAGRRV